MEVKKGFKRQYYSALLSEYAYETNFNKLEKKLKKIGFYLLGKESVFSYDEMDGFVAVCDEGQVVVFRGSEREKENNYKDWQINLDFKLIDINIEGIKIENVAAGYGERIEKYWHKLKPLIWDDTILVTGHSAGGGYALIHAKALKEVLRKKVLPFPHANPKITNDINFLPESVHSVNSSDSVPRFPLWILGRRHTGRMIYFNKRGRYIKNANIKRVMSYILNIFQSSKNHEVGNYVKNWGKNWEKIQNDIEK